MATLEFDGRKPVGAFIEQLEKLFDGVWKVYVDRYARHIADERDRMASVQVFKAPTTGTLAFRTDMYLGNFYELIEEEYGYVVRAFRPDGRVQLIEKIRLNEIEKVSYQASKKDMTQQIERLAHDLDKEMDGREIDRAKEDVDRNRQKSKNRNQQNDADDIIEFLYAIKEFLRTHDIGILIKLLNQYPITDIIAWLGALVTGNPLDLAASSINVLEKLYKIFRHYANK